MTTVTIIGAFDITGLELRAARCARERGDHSEPAAHWLAVADLASALGNYLAGIGAFDVGFTIAPSFGGGAGWQTEAGFTLTFADVREILDIRGVAEWIRAREGQSAVCILERSESFVLHTQPDLCACGNPVADDEREQLTGDLRSAQAALGDDFPSEPGGCAAPFAVACPDDEDARDLGVCADHACDV